MYNLQYLSFKSPVETGNCCCVPWFYVTVSVLEIHCMFDCYIDNVMTWISKYIPNYNTVTSSEKKMKDLVSLCYVKVNYDFNKKKVVKYLWSIYM